MTQLVICLENVNSIVLNNILDYVYYGEVQILEKDLDQFLSIANRYKLEGLSGVKKEECHDQPDYFQENHEIKEENLPRTFHSTEDTINAVEPLKHMQNCERRMIQRIPKDLEFESEDFNSLEELERAIDEKIIVDSNGLKSCSVCGKTSKHNGHMREHVESHIEGLSFPCSSCNFKCRSRTGLRHHMGRCLPKAKSF